MYLHPSLAGKQKKSRSHLLEQCKGFNVNSQLGDYPNELWFSLTFPRESS